MAAVAPAALYLLIFQHWRCETGIEQFTAAALASAGFAGAIKFA